MPMLADIHTFRSTLTQINNRFLHESGYAVVIMTQHSGRYPAWTFTAWWICIIHYLIRGAYKNRAIWPNIAKVIFRTFSVLYIFGSLKV